MNLQHQLNEDFSIHELYIKSITLSFALSNSLSLHFLFPYLKMLSQKPSMKLNLKPEGNFQEYALYHKVGVGGTFDHLHIGHQILLFRSVLLAKNHLFVGVTSDEMLAKKKNKQIIQPCSLRIAKVREFVHSINPELDIQVKQINDPFGPTIVDPDFDCLVVSQQTIKGGQKINEIRVQKQMKELKIDICPALSPESQTGNIETKVSSSAIRQYLLDKNEMNAEDFQEYKLQWKKLVDSLIQYVEINQLSEKLKEVGQNWWFKIVESYSQYWRFYHTNYHIRSMLQEYKSTKFQIDKQTEIVLLLSIWFHDIYYNPSDKQNEEKSAQIAEQFLKDLLPQSQKRNNLIQEVKKAVISTKKHEPSSEVEKILIDLDMSILDSELPDYRIYSSKIQKEYRPLVGKIYEEKRVQFLKTVKIQDIFSYRKPLNIAKNIEWEIENLKGNTQL